MTVQELHDGLTDIINKGHGHYELVPTNDGVDDFGELALPELIHADQLTRDDLLRVGAIEVWQQTHEAHDFYMLHTEL